MRKEALLLGLVLFGMAAGAPAAGAATVVRVVDGDTIRVKSGGRTAAVNLLGVRAGTACGTDGAATLGALLPRRAKVRLVRDGRRGGVYVFRGRSFVNRELVARGVATAAGLRGLRRARALRAAQRTARSLHLGVWSCGGPGTAAPAPLGGGPFGGGGGSEPGSGPAPPGADEPVPPRPAPPKPDPGVDSPENREEMDRYLRGYRFTFTDEFDGSRMQMVLQLCQDGRMLVKTSMTGPGEPGWGGESEGTWKLLGIHRRDAQAFLGLVEVTMPDENGENSSESIALGHRADGTPVMADDEDQMPAERAPADRC
jgi:endonuclease YncB( thermonuclease family)